MSNIHIVKSGVKIVIYDGHLGTDAECVMLNGELYAMQDDCGKYTLIPLSDLTTYVAVGDCCDTVGISVWDDTSFLVGSSIVHEVDVIDKLRELVDNH